MAIEQPITNEPEKGNQQPLFYQEIDLQTGEVKVRREIKVGEVINLVKISEKESIRVILDTNGEARVEVHELVSDKDNPQKRHSSFASHLWLISDNLVKAGAVHKKYIWTRSAPLPFGLVYDRESNSISLMDEKANFKKVLSWK